MSSTLSRDALEAAYAKYADEYLQALPLEHFMEAYSHSTQRKITLESLDLVHVRRPDFQIFSELLVQYPREGQQRPGQVVPDNMVVLWPEPLQLEGSFDMPLQPAGPFWVLEYVSKGSKRKDYKDNFRHYESALRIPYYLVFYPEKQDLRLYHMPETGHRYEPVPPDKNGRYALPEVEIEVGLLEKWVRFWYQGELLPLPAEWAHQQDKIVQQRDRARQQLKQERDRARQQLKQEQDRARQQLEKERQDRLALEKELEALRRQIKTDQPPG